MGTSGGQEASGVNGISGWLTLPIIGLVLTCVFAAVWMFTDYLPLMSDGTWPAVPVSGRALITFEVFSNLVLIVMPIVLLTLIFKKRRILPKLMVGFLAFVLLVVVADSVGILLIGPDLIPDPMVREEAGWSVAEVTQGMLRTLLSSAIWIPYFLMSARVKNTFAAPNLSQTAEGTSPVQPAGLPVVVGTVTPGAVLGTKGDKPRTRTKWVIGVSLAAALVVLALLVWQCAAPSGGVGAASGSVDSGASEGGKTKTYTDPDYGYSLTYPADWHLQEDESVDPASEDSPASEVMAFDLEGARSGLTYYDWFDIMVFELGEQVDSAWLEEIGQNLQSYVDDELSRTATVVAPFSEVVVAGAEGFRVTTTEVLDGTPLKTTLYWLYEGDRLYIVAFQSSIDTWGQNEAVFEDILASFRPAD